MVKTLIYTAILRTSMSLYTHQENGRGIMASNKFSDRDKAVKQIICKIV